MDKKSSFFNEELTPEERALYDRQFRLHGWDQNVLKNGRVLIAGVGGLGCEVAKNLAMVGVGTLDLVDLDIIEHTNLNRQMLFLAGNIGQSKAVAAAEKLREINPNITVNAYHSTLERLDPQVYKDADVIIGGLDSMNARYNLNAQCVRFNKPLIDGGVGGYHGHVYTIFPRDNACYECYPLPAGESDEMAACTVVGVPRKRIHCAFKGNMAFQEKYDNNPDPKNVKHVDFIMKYANDLVEKHNFPPEFDRDEIFMILDRHEPGIITINAVISSIQSHETLKVLNWLKGNDGLGAPMRTYLIFNGMTMKFYNIEKPRNENCRICGKSARNIEVELGKDSPCEDIIIKLQEKGYELDSELVPVLTVSDFDGIKMVDEELSVAENELRNLEYIAVSGFKDGEIYVTLKLV